MRKMLAILIVGLLVLSPISAMAAAKLNTQLIDDAKQALSLMSYGEYKKAVKLLHFAKNAPTASELSDFVDENLPELYSCTVQSDVAVAYLADSTWRIAVPLESPSSDSVNALVLRAKNGKHFDNYKAMPWYDVMAEVDSAQKVIWQDAYDPGDVYIVADN
ncbi:MAG: hypothetical protein RSJ41_01310 [Clostridia bacterium]